MGGNAMWSHGACQATLSAACGGRQAAMIPPLSDEAPWQGQVPAGMDRIPNTSLTQHAAQAFSPLLWLVWLCDVPLLPLQGYYCANCTAGEPQGPHNSWEVDACRHIWASSQWFNGRSGVLALQVPCADCCRLHCAIL